MQLKLQRLIRLNVTLLLTTALALSACNKSIEKTSHEQELNLRVMSFNIEYGGEHVSYTNVIKAIKTADADIVGLQEATGNLQKIAAELGWHYNLRTQILSKHPIIDPPHADANYVYVEVANNKIVSFTNVHLPSDPYGPDAIRDGASYEQVMALENSLRLPVIQRYLNALKPMIEKNIPMFITGDFNVPSYTDWSEANVGKRDFIRYAFPWPVSVAVSKTGFKDSWREIYPDANKNPGLTWWAARPDLAMYTLTEYEGKDRIDFIWFAGSAKAISSEIYGEIDGPEVSQGFSPWPSDHRAVVSSFKVTPVDMPQLVSSQRRVYHSGEAINIDYHLTQNAPAIIEVRNQQQVLLSSNRLNKTINKLSGQWSLPASLFQAGHYNVNLISDHQQTLSNEFWVLDQQQAATITVQEVQYKKGQAISVSWQGAPGNRFDYIAAYPVGTVADYDNGLAWKHINSMLEGEVTLDKNSTLWGWPLEPGDYVLRLIEDDGDKVLAESAAFTVY